MAQRLRVLGILPEDLDLIPSTYIATYSCLLSQFQEIWHPYTDTYAGKATTTKNITLMNK